MAKKRRPYLNRRAFLKGTGSSLLGLGMAPLWMRDARAQVCGEADPVFLIHATFDGAWDQLLALDPRDDTVYGNPSGGKSGLAIDSAYSHLAANGNAEIQTLLNQTGGTGIVQAGNLSFGPAVGRLAEGGLHNDLAIVRGINMGTLTHEVGRRYFLTGKFPQGLAANGNAMGTWVASQFADDGQCPIPNLVVGMETFNADQAQYASGLKVNNTSDILSVLLPLDPTGGLQGPGLGALDMYLNSNSSTCGRVMFDGEQMVTRYLESRAASINLLESSLAEYFTFNTNPSSPGFNPDLTPLYDLFLPGWNEGGGGGNQVSQLLEGSAGQAMIAAQAITKGVSRAVSVELVTGLDHHNDTFVDDHATLLRTGFNALADLITYLKTQQLGETGSSYWDHTVLVVTSDFARTPGLNTRGGRDHHLCSSCLVGGKGIKTNQVVGASVEETMDFLDTNLTTGAAVPIGQGWTVRPSDIQATILQAAGLDASNLSNQNPQIVQALLK